LLENIREYLYHRHNTTGGSSCWAAGVGGTSLLHIITFSRADTSGISNLKFGELLQMLNSPKAPLELL